MSLLVIIDSNRSPDAFSKEFFDGVIAHLNFDLDVIIVFNCSPSIIIDENLAAHRTLAKKFKLLDLYDTVTMLTTDEKTDSNTIRTINRSDLTQLIASSKNTWLV
jgi:hypothetical protein